MNLTIDSKQFRQLWRVEEDKDYSNIDNTRLKDRAWAVCQVIQFLGGKEHNEKLIKELGL